jgi:hypothetical protein
MRYLKIKNDGELDIRLVALMGGTTKSNDQYKIGQFGSGLKYTLAFLIRNNLSFKIFSGIQEVNIYTEKETIRGEEFEIICINGQRTSITTRMGEDWLAWMIVRELWCNALDEGGALWEQTDSFTCESGSTIFYIQVDKQISDVIKDWNKYFIHNQEPISVSSDGIYKIYPPSECLRLYKHGVLIYENTEYKSVFSYDNAVADINELREFKGSPASVITYSLRSANEKAATIFLETVKEIHYEGNDMDYEWYVSKWSDSWKKVIGTGKLIYQKIIDDSRARGNDIDELGLIIVPKNVFKALTKQFEGIGALRVSSKIGEFYEAHNTEAEGKIKQGLTILEHCGYVMHPELKFVYGFFEDKTVLAKVCLDKREVYVSNTFVQKPLFCLVSMLIEENEHFNTGMNDHTREFQQHFIDLYTRQLLAKHEIQV